ncbi:MAG: TonB-dependent receptor [Dysgonamonadaceae bacterium]|jgi:iron complex outermembrane receptor protein|nr:TonB-dependent receptor [Dysgonamonadaceae bacterium]
MKRVFLCFLASALPLTAVFAEEIEKDSSKVMNLREVEVISFRAGAKTPVAYANMDKQTVEKYNFGQDIPFLLTLTPSVIATSDAGTGIGYTGFRIRGTDANRINITTNGIPLNDSESHGVFWVNMPDFASSLEDLQVQRGVGTSTNGAGAFGASINMKTGHIPLEAYGEFNGSYGSFNTAKATFKTGTGIINEHWAFDARLSSINSDGFIDRASVDLKSYFAQGAYFNNNTLLKFITFGGKEKTYHAWDGVPDYILFPADAAAEANRTYNPSGYIGDDENGNPLYYKNQTDNYQQTHYQLSLLQVLNPNLNLNVSLHYTKGLGYYEEYKTRRSLQEYGLNPFVSDGETVKKSDLVRQKHLDNDFGGAIFSLDYKRERWNISLGGGANRYDGRHFGYLTWVKNYSNDNRFFPEQEYYRSKGEKFDANIYLKGNYQLTEALSLYGDLQFRSIDYKINGKNDTWDWLIAEMQNLDVRENFRFFNPKGGLFYQINSGNQVYASAALAHREPNRNNYTDAGVNEIPQPERLTDYELGYKFNNRIFAVGVNLYYMLYKDQLVLNGKVNEIGEPLTSNVPDSYRTGIELTAGIRILPSLKWDGNLTLSRNKIKNYTEYVVVYDADGNAEAAQQADNYGTTNISYSPDVIANSLFSFEYKSFNAGFHSNYVGKQYLDNTGATDQNLAETGKKERSIDAYFLNNLRLAYDFQLKGMKKLSINLLVNNIFNEQYESNGWVWSCYYRQADGSLEPYTEKSYFPQAGTNVLANIVLRF